MNHTMKKILLTEQQSQPEEGYLNKNYLGLVSAIEVECSIRIGTLNTTIGALRELKSGQTLNLNQTVQEPIELLLHDQVIAKGELMSVDDHFALHITEVFSS